MQLEKGKYMKRSIQLALQKYSLIKPGNLLMSMAMSVLLVGVVCMIFDSKWAIACLSVGMPLLVWSTIKNPS